jgi:dTDP-4-dehydrorhamnose reductase
MKILITGSNGLLGQKLIHKLKAKPEINLVATSRGENRLLDKEGYSYADMDITSRDTVLKTISEHKPNVVINTAAMTNVDQCESDKEGCDKLNVSAVEYLIEACEKEQVHLIHLSTDFIFDGEDGPYREEAIANPLSYYGKSKWLAEKLLMKSNLTWSIARTVLVYGVAEEMSRSNIVLWAKGALEKGQPMNVIDDQFRTPTLAEDLADGCILIAEQSASGIYNISGKDMMSVLELVQRVGAFWNLDQSKLNVVSSSTLNQAAKRPPKTGFVLDKAINELGYNPRSFEAGLALVDEQIKLTLSEE